MDKERPYKTVIDLKKKIAEKNNGSNKKQHHSDTQIIAITSGKGGVGKTNIVANLGLAFRELGKKVLILDADLGLGNIDVLLGLTHKYNLSHVFSGEKKLSEIIIEGPGGMKILPAASGIQSMTRLTKDQRIKIIADLERLLESMDILLIDTAAGISSNVMYFNVSAHEIIVVASPEPSSITDAYALMKVLSIKYQEKKFRMIVNMVNSIHDSNEVFNQISMVSDKFLDISIDHLGYIFFDINIKKSVKRQKAVYELYNASKASRCFEALAKKICGLPKPASTQADTYFFWNNLLQKNFD